MGYLLEVTKGKIFEYYFILLAAVDGFGKSTWASEAPDPIFLDLEAGTSQLDVSRLKPESFKVVLEILDEFLNTPDLPYKTLVIDTLDALEILIHNEVCQENNWKDMEQAGYGKAFGVALKKWQTFVTKLEELQEKMNIILLSHVQIRTFQDPNLNAGYDRYELKLNQKAAGLIKDRVRAHLFGMFETFTKKDGDKTRAFSEGTRVVYTERRAAYDAKNRYALPHQLPLSWEDFDAAARKGEPDSPEAIKARIIGLLTAITDPKILDAVNAQLAKEVPDVKWLVSAENKLKQIVNSENA